MKLLLASLVVTAVFYGIVGMLLAADSFEDKPAMTSVLYVCTDGPFASPGGDMRPTLHCMATKEEGE
jgi:hypothetical protein